MSSTQRPGSPSWSIVASRPSPPSPPCAARARRWSAVPSPSPRSRRAPAERPSRIVDNAVYAGGRRVATPDTAADSHEWLTEGFDDRMVWLGLYRPEPASSGSWPSSTGCPSSRSRTPSRPTSGRSSSATATPCSSSSRPRATWTRPRRSSSASCTCSSAATSPSPSGTASRRTSRGCAAGWRASRRCWPRGRRRCCTRSSTPSSTATRRWSRGWPTTSTRSRPRSSAATPASPGASTSCRRRCWSSSAPRRR